MDTLQTIIQVVVGLGILNVWLLRSGRATGYRGGDAHNMRAEFAVYGLPYWFMCLIGTGKVLLALSLIAGIWLPGLTSPAASALAVLMLGALVMHGKVRDPVKKFLPAAAMFILSLFLAITCC